MMRWFTCSLLGMAMLAFAPTAFAIDANNNGIEGDEGIFTPPEGDVPLYLTDTVVNFPTPNDTFQVLFFPHWWNAGDTGFGNRTVPEDPVCGANISLYFDRNGLTCDVLDMDFSVAGNVVGSFQVSSADGLGPVNRSFNFPPIGGGTYELRYTVTRNVNGGCGSVEINMSRSTVELVGCATPVEDATWGAIKAIYE